MGIRLRTTLLFIVLAGVPLGLTVALWLSDYAVALRRGEQARQLATVTTLTSAVSSHCVGIEEDATAIAYAMAYAAQIDDPEAAERVVQGIFGARQRVATARLEVPSASFETVLAKEGMDRESVPKSDEALRAQAKAKAAPAYAHVDAAQGALVVPVPDVSEDGKKGAEGFLTVPVYREPIADLAKEALIHGGLGVDTRVIVVDAQRHVVVASGDGLPAPGADSHDLPIWSAHSQDGGSSVHHLVSHEFEADGERMVGVIQTMPRLGWTVALWRPETSAMSGYFEARRRAFAIGAAALFLALVLAMASSRAVTRPILALVEQAGRIGQRKWESIAAPSERSDEIGTLDRAMHTMAKDLQAGEEEIEKQTRLRADLSRFVSQEVVEGIVSGDLSLELGGQRQPITVLFADMVAFTAAAESLPPERVVAMLNELFTVLTEVTFRHGGTVDKFIGDCLMAVWGAPVADEDHAVKALEAAEDMLRFLEAGRDEWLEEYGVEVRLAIGINSGEAIVGNVGSRDRMEYTVIGDVVNVAARLETLAAPNQVLMTAATIECAGDDFESRRLGERRLTGRSEEVEVYELVAL